MARRSPQTQAKRQREFDKAEKRRQKNERRALRKALKSGELSESPDGAIETNAAADTDADAAKSE
jgi:hypothetical protein